MSYHYRPVLAAIAIAIGLFVIIQYPRPFELLLLAIALLIPFFIARLTKQHHARRHGKLFYGAGIVSSVFLFFISALELSGCSVVSFSLASCGLNLIIVLVATVIWMIIALIIFLFNFR